MKRCLICGTTTRDDSETCLACGEASFERPNIPDPKPEPARQQYAQQPQQQKKRGRR